MERNIDVHLAKVNRERKNTQRSGIKQTAIQQQSRSQTRQKTLKLTAAQRNILTKISSLTPTGKRNREEKHNENRCNIRIVSPRQ